MAWYETPLLNPMNWFSGAPKEKTEQTKNLKEFDQKLNDLKNEIQDKPLEEIEKTLDPSLDADLDKLNVKDPAKKKEIRDAVHEEERLHLAENAPEKLAIDAFISDVENLAVLKSIKTEEKAKEIADKIPFKEEIGKILSDWSVDLKKKGGFSIILAGLIDRFAGLLGGKAKTPEKTQVVELSDDLKTKIEEAFKGNDVELDADPKNLKADYKWLTSPSINIKIDENNAESKVKAAFVDKAKMGELLKAANGVEPITAPKFKVSLRYLRLSELKDAQIERLTAIIEDKDAEYKLPTPDDVSVRKLLNSVVEAQVFENGLKALDNSFKKKLPETPVAAAPTPAPSPTPKT
jgi:hypothetical protein